MTHGQKKKHQIQEGRP